MVKNTCGGNKHKGHARKHVNAKPSNKLRIGENDGELYAVVTSLLGNGMFYAHCIDDRLCLGQIRGKFSGRGRRDNLVELGKWVLVGERPWGDSSSSSGKVKTRKCDLLEVYTDLDRERLRDTVSANWSVLLSIDNGKTGAATSEATDGFAFASERDEEYEALMDGISKGNNGSKVSCADSGGVGGVGTSNVLGHNDWINVDDI